MEIGLPGDTKARIDGHCMSMDDLYVEITDAIRPKKAL